MGFLTASFDGATFKNIEGYRISACFTPEMGMQGLFVVYVWDRMEAGTQFKAAVDAKAAGKAARGALVLSDSERSYTFNDIDLRGVEEGVTRRERYRLMEFRYDKDVLDQTAGAVKLNNSSDAELRPSALDDDYKFSLGGFSQQLLGYRTYVSANDDSVVRFSTVRGKENSFLQKALDLNEAQRQPNGKMPDFTVTFSQGDLEVNRANLVRVYADESYGEMRKIRLPKLSELSAQKMNPEISRIRMADFSGEELLEHDSSNRFVETQLDPNTVEVGTFVFKPGFQRHIKIK
jgi:hypothetical protein